MPRAPRPSPLLRAAAGVLEDARVGPADHVLAAVSGGPDSIALLVALAELARPGGWHVTAAHVDHGLRGEEGASERAAVAAVAASLGVALVDRRLALERGSGLEGRARRARRRALVSMAAEVGATRIALGHTADDQAETVLLRLLRGAGRGALGGMRAARGRLLRPLLASTRADVRHFLADRRVAFVLDRSNADLPHARNRPRRLVMPLLAAEFNPRVGSALAALAARLHDEDDLLDALATARRAALIRDGRLAVAVADEPAALGRRIVRAWLDGGARAGVTAEQVARGRAPAGPVVGRSGCRMRRACCARARTSCGAGASRPRPPTPYRSSPAARPLTPEPAGACGCRRRAPVPRATRARATRAARRSTPRPPAGSSWCGPGGPAVAPLCRGCGP